MESFEENKRLVRVFYELFFNQKNYEEGGKLLDEQIMNRHPGVVGLGRRRMIENFSRDVKEKLPDIHIEVVRVVAEGDFVWTHGLITGLPDGGARLSVDIWKIEDGKLVEHWDVQQPIAPEQDVTELL